MVSRLRHGIGAVRVVIHGHFKRPTQGMGKILVYAGRGSNAIVEHVEVSHSFFPSFIFYGNPLPAAKSLSTAVSSCYGGS